LLAVQEHDKVLFKTKKTEHSHFDTGKYINDDETEIQENNKHGLVFPDIRKEHLKELLIKY
jgi:hypothetical protein